jgi:hypothetical protein
MFTPASENSVRLENLDARLRTILKFKLREFIHLSPFFQDVPVDLTARDTVAARTKASIVWLENCPNKHGRAVVRRRLVRPFAI